MYKKVPKRPYRALPLALKISQTSFPTFSLTYSYWQREHPELTSCRAAPSFCSFLTKLSVICSHPDTDCTDPTKMCPETYIYILASDTPSSTHPRVVVSLSAFAHMDHPAGRPPSSNTLGPTAPSPVVHEPSLASNFRALEDVFCSCPDGPQCYSAVSRVAAN